MIKLLAGVVSFHRGLTAAKPEDYHRIKAKILICHGAEIVKGWLPGI
jgi:dienelactone hydrolase